MVKKVTSKRVAKEASDLLRNKATAKKTKSVAGSALSQREKKVSRYVCPNCGTPTTILRRKCPSCGYAGQI